MANEPTNTAELNGTQRGTFAHHMLKEIYEQPTAVENAIAGRIERGEGRRIVLPEVGWDAQRIQAYRRVYFVGCGTAYHAGLVGRRLLEQVSDLIVGAELASEFRYLPPYLGGDALVIAVSQSGETADTLGAVEEARRRGADVLAVTNVKDSSLARAAHRVVYTEAGPEIAIASTKAYLTQLVCLTLIALYIGQVRGSAAVDAVDPWLADVEALPRQIQGALERWDRDARAAALDWKDARDVFYLGRGLDHAVAMEGQLKLKETSYIHAEALAAGEIKHGTLALIEKGVRAVVLATQTALFHKTLGNIQDVRARGGDVLAIAMEDCPDRLALESAAERVWYVPSTRAELAPMLAIVPLQLLAYHMACARGCDVDRPRNLTKSVTVE